MALDSLNQQLLNVLQTQIPFVHRPVCATRAAVAHDGSRPAGPHSGAQRHWGGAGESRLIRQISAIFDSKELGYHQHARRRPH